MNDSAWHEVIRLTKGFGLAAFEVNSKKAARSSKTVGTRKGLIDVDSRWVNESFVLRPLPSVL